MPVEIVEKTALEIVLRTRCEELRSHAHSEPGPCADPQVALRASFRSAADLAQLAEKSGTGGRAQFELWWRNCPSAGLQVLLWDRWECHGLTRAEYDAFLAAAQESDLPFDRVVDDPQWLGELPALRPQPTWRFHPERFKGVMPFAGRIANIGRERKGNGGPETMNALSDAWRDEVMKVTPSRPLRSRLRSVSRDSRRIFELNDMLLFYAGFVAHGRQIFDIPSQLCEMFRRTDVDDITAESIKVPYPGIYLHFGPQHELAFEPDWSPEGAYVQELRGKDGDDRVLQFCVVFAPADLEKYREFDVNIEPAYVQALAPQHMKMPLAEAVELVLSEQLTLLRREATSQELPGLSDPKAQELAASHGIAVVSAQATRAQRQLDTLGPKHRCFLEMLKLIVNSLAYLTAYPKDVETRWPANTPPSLLKQLAKTENRNEQRRIQSKLASLGFTPVHICGRRLVEEIQRNAATAAGQGHRAVHWRRGHWRRQPHGPHNSLRKLVWLMPTLVNSAGAQDEPLGHVYLVS